MQLPHKIYLLAGVLLTGTFCSLHAQQTKGMEPPEGIVTYAFRSNGQDLKNSPPLQLIFRNNRAYLIREGARGEKVRQYLDYNESATYQVLTLKNNQRYTLKTSFSAYEKAVITRDTATILGYVCRKAQLVVRSNHIDVWFTDALPIKGTPNLEVAARLGLILKMVRNGNFEVYATALQLRKVSDAEVGMQEDPGEIVDEATYRRKEIDSRFTLIPVFTRQQINFGDSIRNPEAGEENTTYRFGGGTVVMKKVHLPERWKGLVFVELSAFSNGDAYDRTGTVFVIPTDKKISFLDALQNGIKVLPVYNDNKGDSYQGVVATRDYLPPLELMRFFTPFGVGKYNSRTKIEGYNWADSVLYRQDITDLLPRLSGDVWVGVYIGNYDKGGHIISLNLKYYPADEGEKDTVQHRFWIEPVFNTLNILEMAGQNYGRMFGNDSLTVRINIPAGLKTLKLRYISTGHGGWGGGDEFNQKLNTLLIDGKKVFEYIPWRTDCAEYRLSNPSSGNFGNGISSSDYSRSGWCPGTTTSPVIIPLNDLVPGWHTFRIAIPMGKPEGGSFSAWNVSGCLIGMFK